jgi:hypothetical protein
MTEDPTSKPEQKELPRYKVVVEYAFDYGEDYPTERGEETVEVQAASQADAEEIGRKRVYDKWRDYNSGIEHIADDYTAVKSCESIEE